MAKDAAEAERVLAYIRANSPEEDRVALHLAMQELLGGAQIGTVWIVLQLLTVQTAAGLFDGNRDLAERVTALSLRDAFAYMPVFAPAEAGDAARRN